MAATLGLGEGVIYEPLSVLADLGQICVVMSAGPGEICVEMPGGATLCAQFGFELGDPGEIVRSLLAQVNSALTPLTPFFNMLDAIKAIGDCIQAIPDCFGPTPDPAAVVECIPGLMQAIDKLLKLVPALSVPIMVRSILDAIILGLIAIRGELAVMIQQVARLAAASIKAERLGNVELIALLDCARGNLDIQLQNKNASMAPLNRLIGLINLALEMAGLPCIKGIGAIASIDADALAALDTVIEVLEAVKAAIPSLELVLPPLPGPDDDC